MGAPVTETTITEQSEHLAALIDAMQESLADVERVMRRDEAGWNPIGQFGVDGGFTREFRKAMADKALVASVADPLIKRGVNLRVAYIWGDGVEIMVEDKPDQGQDVNTVVQTFLDDPTNKVTFTDSTARETLERKLALDGEVFLCLPTNKQTGRVRVRTIPSEQIADIVADPEDDASPWYYLREYAVGTQTRYRAHPDVSYNPVKKDRTYKHGSQTYEIVWDQPVRAVIVNDVRGRGVGDVFASIPWASAYKRFLEDWAKYMASLAKFAWQVTTRGDKTATAAAKMQAALADAHAGMGVAMDPQSKLEAISKSGATIDSESGRPLAAMAAAGLDLPVTTLLGDPGITGARAVAEDVTESSWALFNMRRQLWAAAIRDVCNHVIDSAVQAPAGKLRGTVVQDGDRKQVELPEDDSRTITVKFPERNTDALLDRIKAIQIADQSERILPLVIAKLYLDALGVEDADEVLAAVTTEDGQFMPLDLIDQKVRDQLASWGD